MCNCLEIGLWHHHPTSKCIDFEGYFIHTIYDAFFFNEIPNVVTNKFNL